MIYFIQSQKDGKIKIGVSSDPEKRLRQLQTGSSDKLTILATFPGDDEAEQELHKLFDSLRVDGEWFLPSGEIWEFINNPIVFLSKVNKDEINDSTRELDRQLSVEYCENEYRKSAACGCDCGGYDFSQPGMILVHRIEGATDWHKPDCKIHEICGEFNPACSKIVNGEPILEHSPTCDL